MKNLLILLIMFLIAQVAFNADASEVECSKHPIYCQIRKNNPSLKKSKAMEISNVIYKATKKYKIPSRIYTAILMQESGYNPKAVNQTCGVEDLFISNSIDNIKCVFNDIGIAQINVETAKAYGFDLKRLLELKYGTYAGAEVLSWFYIKYSKIEPNSWYSRYNCGTKPSTKRRTCQAYLKAVSKYL